MTKTHLSLSALLLCLAPHLQAQTTGLQDLPDEVRATVKKELASQRRQSAPLPDSASASAAGAVPADGWRTGPRQGGCAMNIGTDAPSNGRSKQVIVATKPVVQVCR